MKILTPVEMLQEIEAFLSFKMTTSDKPVIEIDDIRPMKEDIVECLKNHEDVKLQYKKLLGINETS